MIKINEVIKNSNGFNYKVIATLGNYTLLESVDALSHEYIIAWCLNKYESGYSWGQGHYFSNLDDAKKCFKEKTLFTVEEAQEFFK
jgi:hypothetical protein